MEITYDLEKRKGQIRFYEFKDKKNRIRKLLVRIGILLNISIDLKMGLECCSKFKKGDCSDFQHKLLWNNLLIIYVRSFEGDGLDFKEVYKKRIKEFGGVHLKLISARNECAAHWDYNKNLISPFLYQFLEDGVKKQENQFYTWHLHHNKFKADHLYVIEKMINTAILYCENTSNKLFPKVSNLTLFHHIFKKLPIYEGRFPIPKNAEDKLIKKLLKKESPSIE